MIRQSNITGGEILYSYNRALTTQLEQVTAGGNTTSFYYWANWKTIEQYDFSAIAGRVVAGDFNGDGKDDIAALRDYGSDTMGIHSFLSTGSAFTCSEYRQNITQYAAANVTNRVVSVDFTGDGLDDIVTIYYYPGNSRTLVHLFPSQSGEFLSWSVYSSNFDLYDSTLLTGGLGVGDFDGDGDTDLAGVYNRDGFGKVHLFVKTDTGFHSRQELDSLQKYFPASGICDVVSGSFDSGSLDGLAVLYRTGTSSAQIHLATGSSSFVGWDSVRDSESTEGATTTLVESVQNGDETLSYTYDALGNITSVSKNGSVVESYTYDSKNQLKSVTRGDDTWEYAYDANGNILSVKKNGTVEKSYTYGDSSWKDLLTAFNGDSITYDAIGNPLTYRDGITFTWANGRRLATFTKDGATTTYTYNGDGNRIKKQTGTAVVEYTVVDGIIYKETRTEGNTTTTLHYLFDENGTRIGFVLNGTQTYYYVFNLQGDIIGILDSSGTRVVEYSYNAWGKLESVTGTNITLGNLNPFRYRGYYYDAESGFYYLQTRYYDPEICRFISPDAYIATGQSILGYNMFAYCLNNPVNFADPSGYRCICLTRRVNTKRHRCESSPNQTVDLTEKLTDFMEDNANELEEYKEENGTIKAYVYFITNVTDGGSLDIKLQDEWKFEDGIEYTFNGKVLRYDDPGNINFGYVGAVLFSEEIL